LTDFNADIDEPLYGIIERVRIIANELDVRWFVIGAYARILLYEQNLQLPQGRLTQDIDFAVMVESWDDYERLRSSICRERHFRPDSKQKQRILYMDRDYFDIVPYGAIESESGILRWPPDGGTVMRVDGFREAHDRACIVMVNGSLAVPVVRPSCYVMLKLFAWDDRGRGVRGKDAEDLGLMFRYCHYAYAAEELFDEHLDAMETVGYDIELAGPLLLGQELTSILLPTTRLLLTALLDRELNDGVEAQLVHDLGRHIDPERPERTLQLLTLFRNGLQA
jgi:predicted nucleotidyltransferase